MIFRALGWMDKKRNCSLIPHTTPKSGMRRNANKYYIKQEWNPKKSRAWWRDVALRAAQLMMFSPLARIGDLYRLLKNDGRLDTIADLWIAMEATTDGNWFDCKEQQKPLPRRLSISVEPSLATREHIPAQPQDLNFVRYNSFVYNIIRHLECVRVCMWSIFILVWWIYIPMPHLTPYYRFNTNIHAYLCFNVTSSIV